MKRENILMKDREDYCLICNKSTKKKHMALIPMEKEDATKDVLKVWDLVKGHLKMSVCIPCAKKRHEDVTEKPYLKDGNHYGY